MDGNIIAVTVVSLARHVCKEQHSWDFIKQKTVLASGQRQMKCDTKETFSYIVYKLFFQIQWFVGFPAFPGYVQKWQWRSAWMLIHIQGGFQSHRSKGCNSGTAAEQNHSTFILSWVVLTVPLGWFGDVGKDPEELLKQLPTATEKH